MTTVGDLYRMILCYQTDTSAQKFRDYIRHRLHPRQSRPSSGAGSTQNMDSSTSLNPSPSPSPGTASRPGHDTEERMDARDKVQQR